jgi:hypothetical protein
MALIKSFRYRGDRSINYRAVIECGWTYGAPDGSTMLLQLETYASDGTTSQVLQLDRNIALELTTILRKVFPDAGSAA